MHPSSSRDSIVHFAPKISYVTKRIVVIVRGLIVEDESKVAMGSPNLIPVKQHNPYSMSNIAGQERPQTTRQTANSGESISGATRSKVTG